jgi:nucleoid DNA-binding protein
MLSLGENIKLLKSVFQISFLYINKQNKINFKKQGEKRIMERLKKEDIIEAIMEAGISETKKGAGDVIATVDAVIEAVAKKLAVDVKAPIGKYITVEKSHVDERQGRNPSTQEVITIPASDKLKIKKTSQLDKLV